MTLPAIDDISTYGGIINNYTEVVDPTTDLSADASNAYRASVAGMTRVSKRLFVIWTNDGSDGTIVTFDSVVGNSNVYHPIISKNGTGHWRLTFPPSVYDMLGNQQYWAFRYAKGTTLSSSLAIVKCVKLSVNVIDVYLYNNTGSLNDLIGQEILIEVY